VVVLEALSMESPKTKALYEILRNMGFESGKRLLILGEYDEKIFISGRNIPGLELKTANALHAYDILNSDRVIFTKGALERLEEVFSA
jgi:large subunit ribosomal protein L4